MKVDELRKLLSGYEKEDIIKVTVEFYKLIPKAKKDTYNFEDYLNNPDSKKPAVKSKELIDLDKLNNEIQSFIEKAESGLYLRPNREISKKDRTTWRFKVKNWYNDLAKTQRDNDDTKKQAKLLKELYNLLCESCAYTYFRTYDTFDSIGVTQVEFFNSVLLLMEEAEGKIGLIEEGILLIVTNSVNRHTLHRELMSVYLNFLNSSDLKYKAINTAQKLFEEAILHTSLKKPGHPRLHVKKKYINDDYMNDTVELVLRLYLSLAEYDEGIKYYNMNYNDNYNEVKLYVLIRILIEFKLPDHILSQIDLAKINKVPVRNDLIALYDHINFTGEIPKSSIY